ncbi:MAG: FAD-dependent thymidylate synthase [Euryarchaeota archaeon]|nr:FAD-dependent thymidylate synthase [Euryarchaeota archaeon]
MKVTLISHTPEPELACALAAKTCHAAKMPKGPMTREGMKRMLDIVIGSGHTSVLEHASFTFAVEGVSRSLTHQLVRHRMASFSQQSQRHVRLKDFEYVVPPTVEKSPKTAKAFRETMSLISDAYGQLAEMGVPLEDARYVLPNAATSNIVVTMNARSLHNFFELRSCLRAQWEIRKLANLMLREVQKKAPLLFEWAGPICKARGICMEGVTDCKFYKLYVKKKPS